MFYFKYRFSILLLILFDSFIVASSTTNGPLGHWPTFKPIGFITAPSPQDSTVQTHLYGDWGGILGEEFIFIQDNLIKIIYHSYHESYLSQHPLEKNILTHWQLGYDKETKIKFLPLVKNGGETAYNHSDTPGYIQHPITKEHLLYYEAKPGTKDLNPEWQSLLGWETSIQVATSNVPPTINIPFTQSFKDILIAEYDWEKAWNNNGQIKGGLSEPTPVWVPHLGKQGKIRLFYRGLNGSTTAKWNWRISYADSEDGKTNWVKNKIPTFDPSDTNNPAYKWTQPPPIGFGFRGSWQGHCTGDTTADGVHMVVMVSNQNFAGNGHLAYYWSPDWGDTWHGHPDNPILAPGEFPKGVPITGFQRTPTLAVDEEYNRYILAYNATMDVENEKSKRRTFLAIASRDSTSIKVNFTNNPSFTLLLSKKYKRGIKIAAFIPIVGKFNVMMYSATGRLIAHTNQYIYSVGRKSVLIEGHFNSGVYIISGSLFSTEQKILTAKKRIIITN